MISSFFLMNIKSFTLILWKSFLSISLNYIQFIGIFRFISVSTFLSSKSIILQNDFWLKVFHYRWSCSSFHFPSFLRVKWIYKFQFGKELRKMWSEEKRKIFFWGNFVEGSNHKWYKIWRARGTFVVLLRF